MDIYHARIELLSGEVVIEDAITGDAEFVHRWLVEMAYKIRPEETDHVFPPPQTTGSVLSG